MSTEAQKKKRRAAGKRSQRKGGEGERNVAEFLSQRGFPAARRAASAGQAASGANNPDVVGAGGWWVEAKWLKRIVACDYLEQAQLAMKQAQLEEKGPYRAAVVLMRQNGGRLVALMDAEDWADIAAYVASSRALIDEEWRSGV